MIALLHQLHGVPTGAPAATASPLPPPIGGWTTAEPPLEDAAIEQAWRGLADRHGVTGRVRVERGEVRPRAFVVEPGAEVIVAVPRAIATPAARFAVLHELGHAIANLAAPAGIPRALDEAVASYVARAMELPGVLDAPWWSPLAADARARRTLLARTLDAIERAVPDEPPAFALPWALWHDPGAQAAYVTAEELADRWWAELGATPARGTLAAAIATERARLDRATVI